MTVRHSPFSNFMQASQVIAESPFPLQRKLLYRLVSVKPFRIMRALSHYYCWTITHLPLEILFTGKSIITESLHSAERKDFIITLHHSQGWTRLDAEHVDNILQASIPFKMIQCFQTAMSRWTLSSFPHPLAPKSMCEYARVNTYIHTQKITLVYVLPLYNIVQLIIHIRWKPS